MKRGRLPFLSCALILGGPHLKAQDVFILSMDGPSSVTKPFGFSRETYHVSLTHLGPGPGAQAWSYGVQAWDCSVVGITTEGTAADTVERGGFRRGGYERTDTAYSRDYDFEHLGAVSTVVLSLDDPVTLPSNSSQKVALLDVQFDVVGERGRARLGFTDEYWRSGPPVMIEVTQAGLTREPALQDLDIEVLQADECCESQLNLGFSEQVIRRAAPFEGILGTGSACSAGEGVILHDRTAGPRTVHVNIVSDFDGFEEGVQGWSLGVAIEGSGEMISATTAGTAADTLNNGGLLGGGFSRTELTRDASPHRGAVSAIVLTLGEAYTLPPRGTESVLALEIASQGDGESLLFPMEGLEGRGQPVPILMTFRGRSRRACNEHTARVRILHGDPDDFRLFMRGDANGNRWLDIGDAIWIVNELYLGGPAAACSDDADSNDDGRVDLSDIVSLLEHLFRMGPSPPAPFPECGMDPTPDELSCSGSPSDCE